MRRCASLHVARMSNCPSNKWKTQIYHLLHRDDMSIINIGANTGSNVNEFLVEHNPLWNVTPQMWHKELRAGCGVCGACKTKITRGARPVKSIRAIAIELLYINFVALAHNFQVFRVPGVALNAAGGADMTTVFAPRPDLKARTGVEYLGLSTKSMAKLAVPMVNVDGLTTMFNWDSAIDLLSIDTEGHDAYVLEGAQKGLKSKKFRIVEFEYHETGGWRVMSLNKTVGGLMNYGYTCFWQGRNAIAQYEVKCNNEFHKWSNLVCAHEYPIVAELVSLSIKDVQDLRLIQTAKS